MISNRFFLLPEELKGQINECSTLYDLQLYVLFSLTLSNESTSFTWDTSRTTARNCANLYILSFCGFIYLRTALNLSFFLYPTITIGFNGVYLFLLRFWSHEFETVL